MRKQWKRTAVLLLAAMLLVTAVPFFLTSASASDENRTVRVGFFAYPGYHELNDGVRSGYGYDFLELLRRYTNLNFEYVGYENSWEEMQQMLLNGEIDLVTSTRKTVEREKLFDFSEPIGENRAQINVRMDDERFIPGDFAALNGVTLGEIAGNSRNADVQKFAEEKGFSFKVVEFAGADELEQALRDGKVDAAASSSLRKSYGEKTVAEIAPEDFYVIVKKGNTELLKEINYGIGQMDANEGNWRDDLYYINYKQTFGMLLSFSKREQDYIRDVQRGSKTITVAAQPDRDPYSFVANGELTGIIPDYFAHLMEMAGLPYTTLVAKDREEFQTWTMTNYPDVIMDCRYASAPSADLPFGVLTDSYMILTTSRVTRKGFTGDIRSIATVDSQGTNYIEEDIAGNAEYVIVPTREDAMRAVKNGKADACYVYTYMAEKFINADPDGDLQYTILREPVYSEYIYVSPNADHELAGILNKCIHADSSGILDEYVKQYTSVTYENLNFGQYLRAHPALIYTGIALLVLLLSLIAAAIFRAEAAKMKNAQLKRELEQKQQLDESLTFTNFFLDTYVSAYYVNLDTLECKVYKRTEELERHFPIITSYLKSLTEYIETCVHPDDRASLLAVIQPDRMKELLIENREYHHIFRDMSDGTERQYRMQVIRGADESQAAFGFLDITRELLEQQQHLLGAVPLSSDILTKANIGLWSFELDEGQPPRMYADEAMLKLLALDHQIPPEEIYHAWYDYIDEGSYGLVTDAVAKMSAGEHAEVQYPWHHPDGHTMIVRCGGVRNPEYTSGIRIEGTHQDVTETLHFQSEGAKRDRDIIEILASEYSSVYYIDLTTDGLTPYTMNERTESVFGKIFRNNISYSDAYEMYVSEQVLPEDRDMMMNAGSIQNIARELSDKKTFITTYRDSNGHFSEMKFVKVGDASDLPSAVALGFADKDEELREEARRKMIAERDAAVIAGLSDDFGCVVYVEYETGNEVHYRFDPLLSANIPGWEQITVFDERLDILSKTLVHPDDMEFFRSREISKLRILDTVQKEGVFYHNFRVIINGETKYYQLKIIRDEKTQNHIIAGFRNVDETVRREMEYQEKLEAANRSKTNFLFNMSHDIRTPMNAIIGFTQIAKKHIDDRERTIDSLSKIEASGNHLLNLINEVLDMSRVEAGKLHSEMKTVNVSEAASKLVMICQESAQQRDICLTYEEKNVVHPVVIADELHINQIIMNILGNAIKYTEPGGSVRYTVEEIPSEVPGYGRYLLTISDTGIGMSAEYLRHIFESFSREENALTSKIQGTGLGMSIVKRLVDYMDGTIDIESEQGVGTTVTVVLPMKLSETGNGRTQENEKKFVRLSGKRALLVEDNELNREIASEILEEQGILVEMAENGFEAVDCVKDRGAVYYDFVLMDIQMPRMDGYTATRKIRELPGTDKLPIIALSANAFEEDKRKSIESGMNDHVSKPIVIEELLEALSRFLQD